MHRFVVSGFVVALTALAGPASAQVTLAPGFLPTPWQAAGVVTGSVDAANYGPGCIGQITPDPLYTVTLTEDFAQLAFAVSSTIDATLVIQGPDDAVFCNDDFDGTNPRVNGQFAAGTYRVWIGTYHGNEGTYTLSVTEDGAFDSAGGDTTTATSPAPTDGAPSTQDPPLQPAHSLTMPVAAAGVSTIGFGPGSQPDPATASVTAGGSQPGDAAGAGCVGSINTTPSATLALTGDMSWMRITAVSDTDVTLVVVNSDGDVWCNDDTHGFNPEVSGPMTAGTYGIYVGTYGAVGTVPAVVEVSAAPRPANTATGNTASEPETPSVADGWRPIAPGFLPDPMSATGTSGGTVDATPRGATSNGPCRGSVPEAPQHTLILEEGFDNLTVSVDAPTDTTLVIEGPDFEVRCNDDSNRFNPSIDGGWSPGTWRIFVGAYGQPGPYTLTVTEL